MGKFTVKKYGEVTALEMKCGWSRRPVITVYGYIVDGIVIDTGPRTMQRHLLDALQRFPVQGVLLTHHHEDHSGNAAALRKKYGIPIYGHPYARKKLANGYRILPYQHLFFRAAPPVKVTPMPEAVEIGDLSLKPIHTPGHSKDHTVYWEKNRGWLFSGDLYVGSRVKFFRIDEDFSQTLDSLRRVAALDFDRLFCAHNPQMTDAKSRVLGKLAFFEDFLGELAQLRDHRGMDLSEATKHLAHRGDPLVRWITFGNACFHHFVRSAWLALATTENGD